MTGDDDKQGRPKLVEQAGCEFPVAERGCGMKRANIFICGLCDNYKPRWVLRQPREK